MRRTALCIIMILLLSLSAYSNEEKGTFDKELFEQFIGNTLIITSEGDIRSETVLLIDVKDEYLVLRSSAKGKGLIFIKIDSIIEFYVYDYKDIESFYRKKQ